ncbi:MAG: SusC/RagA family TonB-linked outer membrane protein [Bacteroidota bacterium]
MKKLSLALVLVLFAIGSTLAQRTIMGTVTDTEGEALIGANILLKGTTTGTVTDVEGKYKLDVPTDATTLVLSYTGYETQEVSIGASDIVDVTMSEGLNLTEVVVTGLGIKKEKKALGYAITTISSADVELKPEADVGRILRGKVPGVDITSTSGLSGTGTNIIIRGYSSITGNNQPLFVIDGVPFNTDANSDRGFDAGGATASSRFLDLDPNQIKEVSVLKGLSATVLYGEAGRNGVVLVTTKNGDIGNLDKKFEVTLSQSLFVTEVGGVPQTQQSYGNGWQNDASNAFSNWGAPFPTDPTFSKNINGITNGGSYQLDADGTIVHPYSLTNFSEAFPELQGTRIPWQWFDNLNQFFGTGLVNQTSISIANKISDGSALSFSYSLLNDEGFVPNNDLQRHNFGVGFNTKLNNGLKVITSFNFTTSERNTPPASPIFSSNPTVGDGGASLFSNVLYTPVSHDLFGWPYFDPRDNSSVYYRSNNSIQNVRWTSENINDNEKVRRFFGNVTLNYDITDWLRASYRFGLDTYTQQIRYSVNKLGIQLPDGLLITSERLNFITDQVASLIYDYDINDDFNISGVLGANLRRERRDYTIVESTQQLVFGLQTHQNFITHSNSSFTTVENTIGAYLTASLGYKNFLYFNFQGRNDWTSTLEPENRSVFYPSGSVAFIPTEVIPALQNSQMINYLKLRVGYGTSAGYPDPYQTRNILDSRTREFQLGSRVLNTNSIDNRFGNPDLTHERHQELEIGLEGKFFKNRVGIDFSFYDKESSDLIIDLELDPSTGYTNSTINSARIDNRGFEIGLNIRPLVLDDFVWDFATNFTRNRSRVLAIADGIDQVLIDGLNFLGNFAMAPYDPEDENAADLDDRSLAFGNESGGVTYFQYGAIQGSRVLRNEDGEPIIGGDGLYQADPVQGVIGDPNPDFDFNFINTFSWKGIALRVQIDWQQGGDIWGSTASTLTSRGIAAETGFDRFVPVVVPGVLDNGDGTFRPNNIQVSANNHYWRDAGVWYDENRIFDATTIRLREVSLSYSLPSALLKNTPIGSFSITLSGQNMWYKAVNFPDSINFDPEVLSLGVGNGQGFDFVTGPTAKRYGASIRLTF